MVATKENGIQPVVIVDGGGEPVIFPADSPSMFTASQALAAGAMDATDAIATVKTPLWFALAISGAGLVAAQTLTMTFDSADGATFDTEILRETLPIGTTSKFFSWPCSTLMRAGDHVRYQLDNAGGGETETARLSAMYGV